MHTMKKRLMYFISEVLGVTVVDFAKSIGTSNTYIYQIMSDNGKRSFGLDLLHKIKKAYPALNLNWLIYDQGDITLTGDSLKINTDYSNCPYCKTKDETISVLNQSLKLAIRSNEELNELLKTKNTATK